MIKWQQASCHSRQNIGAIPAGTLFWLTFSVWLVTLFVLSSIPGSRFGPLPFSGGDKAVHVLLFTIGSLLLASAYHRTFGKSLRKTMLLIFFIMVLIGAGDEYHQIYTPGRSGNDPGDLAADAIGALIGVLSAGFLHANRASKTNFPASGADREA